MHTLCAPVEFCSRGFAVLCMILQVFAQLDEYMDIVKAIHESQVIARLRRVQAPVKTAVKTDAANAIKMFMQDVSGDSSSRLTTMTRSIEPFEHSSQKLMPTSWSRVRPPVSGLIPLDLTDKKTMHNVMLLCKQQKLMPPSGLVKSDAFHYGKYDNSKLVCLLSLRVMNLNRMPGSICVSIDIAASNDKNHAMTIAIDSIKKMMRKRRNPCVLLAQVAQTDKARLFWNGKLTKTKRASVMTALLSAFDNQYQIYEDTEDMALFFE